MEADTIKSYVEDLFKYLKTYEKNYSQFKTEAFFQTYNGIYAVFQALQQQRDKAVELDYVFLDRVREKPLTESDLRQIAVQTLITFFESVALPRHQTGEAGCAVFRETSAAIAVQRRMLQRQFPPKCIFLERGGAIPQQIRKAHTGRSDS
jgi:hypothetical protein